MTLTVAPVVGGEFTHDRLIEPTWKPGPGQKYRDAPKAVMVITAVRRGVVYYRYRSSEQPHAAFRMSTLDFTTRYGAQS